MLIKHGETALRTPREFSDFRNRMFQLFEEPFGLPVFRQAVGWVPDVDVSETDGEIIVRAELPGMTKQDVEIDLEGNVLTLKGEKKEEREEKEKERYLYESSYGAFQRAFTLPTAIREDQVRAELQSGVLKITLPKAEEAKGKKIEING